MTDEPKKEEKPRRRASDFLPTLRRSTDNLPPLPGPQVSAKAARTSKEIRSQLRVLVALTVILYIGLGGLVWYSLTQSDQNTRALCAIRHQAEQQVTQGQAFLKSHPNGAFGFTATQIQANINNSLDEKNALSEIGC